MDKHASTCKPVSPHRSSVKAEPDLARSVVSLPNEKPSPRISRISRPLCPGFASVLGSSLIRGRGAVRLGQKRLAIMRCGLIVVSVRLPELSRSANSTRSGPRPALDRVDLQFTPAMDGRTRPAGRRQGHGGCSRTVIISWATLLETTIAGPCFASDFDCTLYELLSGLNILRGSGLPALRPS